MPADERAPCPSRANQTMIKRRPFILFDPHPPGHIARGIPLRDRGALIQPTRLAHPVKEAPSGRPLLGALPVPALGSSGSKTKRCKHIKHAACTRIRDARLDPTHPDSEARCAYSSLTHMLTCAWRAAAPRSRQSSSRRAWPRIGRASARASLAACTSLAAVRIGSVHAPRKRRAVPLLRRHSARRVVDASSGQVRGEPCEPHRRAGGSEVPVQEAA